MSFGKAFSAKMGGRRFAAKWLRGTQERRLGNENTTTSPYHHKSQSVPLARSSIKQPKAQLGFQFPYLMNTTSASAEQVRTMPKRAYKTQTSALLLALIVSEAGSESAMAQAAKIATPRNLSTNHGNFRMSM